MSGLAWKQGQDSDRHEEKPVWRTTLSDGYLLTVAEVSVGEWGWTITDPRDGFPCELRYGFPTPEAARANAEEHVKDNS